MPEKKLDKNKAATGALIGGGGTTAAVGALGGGVPGFKSKSSALEHVKHGTFVQRTGAAAASLRGGIFGYRTDAHRGFLQRQQADEKHFAGKPASRVDMFHRGVGSGKIKPEVDIIRHMKAGKKASGVALVGGGAALATGIHRAKHPEKVHKAQKRSDTVNTGLVAGGGTAAGVSYGGARVMESQGRKWNAKAARGYDEAAKIVPNMQGHKTGRGRNPRVGSVRAAVSDDTIAESHKKYLAGKSKVQVEAAGRLRGAAQQHGYFGHVYGKTANLARKVPRPALAVAGVGAVGMGATRAADKLKERATQRAHLQKSYDPRMSAFGVVH